MKVVYLVTFKSRDFKEPSDVISFQQKRYTHERFDMIEPYLGTVRMAPEDRQPRTDYGQGCGLVRWIIDLPDEVVAELFFNGDLIYDSKLGYRAQLMWKTL